MYLHGEETTKREKSEAHCDIPGAALPNRFCFPLQFIQGLSMPASCLSTCFVPYPSSAMASVVEVCEVYPVTEWKFILTQHPDDALSKDHDKSSTEPFSFFL